MRISIAKGLENGSAVFCVIQGTVVISSHPTIKEAIDARRNLVLPLPDRDPRNSVIPATPANLVHP
jgi:hypothetical protein